MPNFEEKHNVHATLVVHAAPNAKKWAFSEDDKRRWDSQDKAGGWFSFRRIEMTTGPHCTEVATVVIGSVLGACGFGTSSLYATHTVRYLLCLRLLRYKATSFDEMQILHQCRYIYFIRLPIDTVRRGIYATDPSYSYYRILNDIFYISCVSRIWPFPYLIFL
jgi:hypothetical protein